MNMLLALILWAIAAGATAANGYLSTLYLKPRIGQYGTQICQNGAAISVLFGLAGIYAWQTQGSAWLSAALGAGLLWLALTVIVEFAFGHYVLGNSWGFLLADYQVWKGRLWPVVVIVTAIAPLLMAWIIHQWVNAQPLIVA